MHQKRKIINDPVFGFITIPNEFIYNLIQHPFLQRLNRIRQLGLAAFVYPGAQHTRFHHSLGAMYLMDEALQQLRLKNNVITEEEYIGALSCILLHDTGHGPFSHVLEHTLVTKVQHETISLMLMERLNKEWKNQFDICLSIFKDEYPKHFLHQLVSGQLDVDRLDDLRRDSYFTGVTEGNIGSARIIKMLDVRNDKLVVESKGIYSIENFLTSRRLMYWQVYLHKTAVAAEKTLINTLMIAKELAQNGAELFASPSLSYFLRHDATEQDFRENPEILNLFLDLDDNDIWSALKVWSTHKDLVLSLLSKALINRKLFKIEISRHPHENHVIAEHVQSLMKHFIISEHEARYLVSSDIISTDMYNEYDDSIDILYRDESIRDISEASDMLNIDLLSKRVEKYYFAYYKID